MTDLFLSVLGISLSIGLIVAILLALAPFLNRRYASKWKYWIWIVLALRLLIPFSGSDRQPTTDTPKKVSTAVTSQQKEKQAENENATALQETATPPQRMVVALPPQMTTPIVPSSEKNNADMELTLLDIIAFVWLVGCLLFIAVHLFSYAHYKRLLMKRGTVIEDERVLRQIARLSEELHIRQSIPVIRYPDASSPMVIGFINPVLVLPQARYRLEELFFILKHELIHLKRKDVYFKLLLTIANAVHWFNPLIWLMQKEAVVDMELSCDEKVVQGTEFTVRKAYTETLFSTLHRKCGRKTVLSTQFYGGKQVMKKRFQNILMRANKKNGFFVLLGAVVLAIGMGTLIGCSAGEYVEREQIIQTDITEETVADGTKAGGVQLIEADVADIVLEKAEEIVAQDYAWYAEYAQVENHYTDWRIESLTHCYTYDDFNGSLLQIYRLNFEFLSATPDEVVLIGGMTINEDGWVVPGYANSNYLVFEEDGENFTYLTRMVENDCFPGDDGFRADLERLILRKDVAMGKALLAFMVEGIPYREPASLVTGDGYSLYLTDGEWVESDAEEVWYQSDNEWHNLTADTWEAKVNPHVKLWVTHFEGQSVSEVKKKLEAERYVAMQNGDRWRQETGYNVVLKESEQDAWGVFYCYPTEAEEGWGNTLPVIADTFSAMHSTNVLRSRSNSDWRADQAVGRELQGIVEEFATAYFCGDAETVQGFLTSPYEWGVEVYEGNGTISELTIKGLPDLNAEDVEEELSTVSLEFADSEEDSLSYLSFTFVKEGDVWKIKSYGLEK